MNNSHGLFNIQMSSYWWKMLQYGWIFGTLFSLGIHLFFNGVITTDYAIDKSIIFFAFYMWSWVFRQRAEIRERKQQKVSSHE